MKTGTDPVYAFSIRRLLTRSRADTTVRTILVRTVSGMLILVLLGAGLSGPTLADELIADPVKRPVARSGLAPAYQAHIRRRARTVETTEQAWRFDFLDRIFEETPSADIARRPRVLPARKASRTGAVAAALNGTESKWVGGHKSLVAQGAVSVAAVAPVTTNPIVTGAVPVPPKPNIPLALQGDELVMTAERAQAAQDLTKLELALRTYDELRQSGQPAFGTRPDWRVLERAQDALSNAELSAAHAVGFEANAYINEAQKTIVIGIAGTKDLRRHLIAADIWQALIKAEQPQHFFMAKSYARSVITRYQLQGFHTECVGHSLGGGACAYLAGELGIRAVVVNPITAGHPAPGARFLVTNYVVDGDIASLVYGARGNAFGGEFQWINDGRGAARLKVIERFGALAGPILVVKDLRSSLDSHKLTRALDLIALHAGVERIK
jgi:hypothetical protein